MTVVNRHGNGALLYSAVCGQALSGDPPFGWLLSLADPRFSSGSAVWLSQHGIRKMGWNNLTRVLIADRHKSPGELTPSIVPRGTTIRRLAELEISFSFGTRRHGPFRQKPECSPWSSGTPCRPSTCDA